MTHRPTGNPPGPYARTPPTSSPAHRRPRPPAPTPPYSPPFCAGTAGSGAAAPRTLRPLDPARPRHRHQPARPGRPDLPRQRGPARRGPGRAVPQRHALRPRDPARPRRAQRRDPLVPRPAARPRRRRRLDRGGTAQDRRPPHPARRRARHPRPHRLPRRPPPPPGRRRAGRRAGGPPPDGRRLTAFVPVATGRPLAVCLFHALRAAREAVDHGRATGSMDAFTTAVGAGVSHELTEALVALVQGAEGARVGVDWAPAAGVPEGCVATAGPVEFSPGDLPVLLEAGRRYRRAEPSVTVTVTGAVVRMYRARPRGDGLVRLRVLAGADVGHLRVTLGRTTTGSPDTPTSWGCRCGCGGGWPDTAGSGVSPRSGRSRRSRSTRPNATGCSRRSRRAPTTSARPSAPPATADFACTGPGSVRSHPCVRSGMAPRPQPSVRRDRCQTSV